MKFKNWFLLEMPMQWGNNLALFTAGEPHPTEFALFQISSEWNRILHASDVDAAANYLYGIMSLRDNEMYKAWEIDAAWARHGYGPFMCLIAMSLIGNTGLISTRVPGQVSPEMARVWKEFYDGAGKNLVTWVPLEDAKHHPQDYLNVKYFVKQPINLQPLLRRGKLTFRNDRHGEKQELFHELIDGFLRSRMHDVYGD